MSHVNTSLALFLLILLPMVAAATPARAQAVPSDGNFQQAVDAGALYFAPSSVSQATMEEVIVRGFVSACANKGGGLCDTEYGWGMVVREIVQSSPSCPMKILDTAWVQIEEPEPTIASDIRVLMWLEVYGYCSPQPENQRWPYLIQLWSPNHYAKAIAAPSQPCSEGAVKILETCPDGQTWSHRQVCRNNVWVDEYQECPRCSEGAVRNVVMCPDGINWTQREVCRNNNWVPESQRCTLCSEGAINVLETCPDGSWKHRQVCRNNAWVEETQQCVVCSAGAVKVLETCPDGSWKRRQVCKNNAWVEESQLCPVACPNVVSVDVKQLHDFGGISDYWHYIYAQAGIIPYYVDDLVDVKLDDSTKVSSVQISMSGVQTDTVALNPTGSNSYQRILQYYPMMKDDIINLSLFLLETYIVKLPGLFSDVMYPPFTTGDNPPPRILQIHIKLADGTSCPPVQVDREIPTYLDSFMRLQRSDGSWDVTASPIDMLVVDSTGRRVGSFYQNGAFVQEVDEIPGALYSGHGTHPQIIFIPSVSENHVVVLMGTGTGSYRLVSASVSSQQTLTYSVSGSITQGQTVQYSVEMQGDSLDVHVLQPASWWDRYGVWLLGGSSVLIAGSAMGVYASRRRKPRPFGGRPPRVLDVRPTAGKPKVKSIQETGTKPRVLKIEEE